MPDSKSRKKKPVQETQTPRPRKPKLERVNCDTTERKRSEETLLSERNKMLSAFEAMEDGVYIVNQQHDIQYVNPVLEKDFGPWQGCKCYQYFHDRKEVCPWCKNEQVFAGKTVRWEWYSFKNRKTYDLIDTPLKNPDGSLSKLEIFRDITERKKVEEQLKQSTEFLANTINALDDTFFVKDEEHRWAALNDAACEAIGRPREELIGKSDYDLFPKEQADVFWEKDNLVFETGETNVNEEEVTWHGKSHTISTKKSLFKDSITGKRFIVGTARDITERRQMEKTLRESEQKYRALVEQSSYGIVILQDYRIVFANKAAAKIPGLTMEKLQSLSLEDMIAFVPHENRESLSERLKNRFAGKNEPANYELRLIRRNGEEFWLNLFFSNIEYQGKFAIQLAFVDITDQKRMEEALRRSEIQFREIFENTPVGVYRTTPDGRVLMANPALVHMLGFSSFEELSQRNLEEEGFEPQYQRSIFREELERKGRIVSWESIWTTREGKKLYVIENARAVKDEEGKILYYEGTAENITERKRAEKELKQSKEFLSNAINAIDDPFFAKDEEHRWTVLNDAACKVMGRTREELIGKSDYDLFAKEQADVFWERDNLVLKNGVTDVNEEEITWHGKLHTISTKKSVFTDSITGKKFIVGTIRDITERKKTEEALRESEQRYRAIFEQAADSIVLIDVETGELVEFNDRTHKNLGYTREEFRNLKIPDFEVIESAEETRKHLEKITRTGADTFETKHRTKEGEIRDIQISSRAISIRDKDFVQSIWHDITERKKAEEALTESEEKFRNLSEQSPNMIFINRQGRVVYANKKCEEVMGYKREEFYHPDFDFMTLIAPEFRQLIKTNLSSHMKGEEVKPYEYGLITKDGEKLDAIITTKLMKYDGENSILGTITDITERKQTEEKLRVREQTLRAFLNAPTESAILVDTEGTILDINRIAAQRLGKSAEELIGMGIYDYLPTDIAEYRKARGAEVIRSGKPLRFQDERADRYYDNNIYPVFDDEGKVSAIGVFSGDITERKRAQEALKESEEKYRAIVERAPDSIVTVDLKGIVTSCNTALLEQTGYSEQDFVGRHFTKNPTMRIKDIPKYLKIFRSLVTGKVPEPLELVGIYKDGSEHLGEVHISIIRKRGKIIGFQAMTRDITERKQAEEKLREYQEQLKSLASELTLAEERERRRIATELHDEISQSLFISKMKLEALDKSASDKKYDDTIDEINNSLGRIIAAMRSLTFDLSSPILYEFGFEQAVAEWLNEQVEKKHGIATELEDDGLPKQLDDDIRVILFRNVRELLINVVKHARAKKVKVSIQKVDNRIRVSVEDDGVGFESARAESLITKKEAFGLFSIRERLESLGGNLEIKSSPGCGCRITITSPLKREDISEGKRV